MSIDKNTLMWIALGLICTVLYYLSGFVTWLHDYPKAWMLPISEWINTQGIVIIEFIKPPFKATSWLLSWPVLWIQTLLTTLPWVFTVSIFTLIAYRAKNLNLAIFAGLSLLYMVVTGFWVPSMNTLALVFIAVPVACLVGFFLGVLVLKSHAAKNIIQPILDLMQTIPAFAYLIPILLLFGFGPVVGVIASVIYSLPCMVRNTSLGLSRVPKEIIESGMMSGVTKRQSFWMVEVPTAIPTILVGLNQTIMQTLNMVIIAAVIGSTADIGWEVLNNMRKALFGESLIAGFVVALLAMTLDRISCAYISISDSYEESKRFVVKHFYLILLGIGLATYILGNTFSVLRDYPEDLIINLAPYLNNFVNYLVVTYSSLMDAIKAGAYFFFLMPLSIGLDDTINQYTWGFEFTDSMRWSFIILSVIAISLVGYFTKSKVFVITLALFTSTVYLGITSVPWPIVILVVTFIAYRCANWKVAVFALMGLSFFLVTGLWQRAMLSVYLCFAAVMTSMVLGGLLGFWASQNDKVSRFIHPILDTLQTMPLFVFLIPVIMFFQVGDFVAYLAIIAYAIVPAVRYTEHGLKNVPLETIEAGIASGCTKWQVLVHIKLPLALPEIMLGLNQTILFALAMLVITALVGTNDMGQQIYIALGEADLGKGLVAGLGIALIAMIPDRIIQTWCKEKKETLGIL